MSRDMLNPIVPEGKENTKEIQQLPVQDEENTCETAMQLALQPAQPQLITSGNISGNTKVFKLFHINQE